MEKKKSLFILIVCLVIVLLIGGLYFYLKASSNKTTSESKIESKKESERFSVSAEQKFIDDEKSNSSYIDLDRIEKRLIEYKDTKNIFSNKVEKYNEINGKKVISELSCENCTYFAVTSDGKLYTDTESLYVFTEIELNTKLKRVGRIEIIYSSDQCEPNSTYIVETENGDLKILDYDYETKSGKLYEYDLLEADNSVLTVFPVCYGSSINIPSFVIDNNKNISFEGIKIMYRSLIEGINDKNYIKNDNDNITVSKIILTENYVKKDYKFYIISDKNELFIVDKRANNYSPVAKVKDVNIVEGNDVSSKDKITIILDNEEKLVFNIN